VVTTTGLWTCPSLGLLTVIRTAEGVLDLCQKCIDLRKESVTLTFLSFVVYSDLVINGPSEGHGVA
jgi:hypothetical protein